MLRLFESSVAVIASPTQIAAGPRLAKFHSAFFHALDIVTESILVESQYHVIKFSTVWTEKSNEIAYVVYVRILWRSRAANFPDRSDPRSAISFRPADKESRSRASVDWLIKKLEVPCRGAVLDPRPW